MEGQGGKDGATGMIDAEEGRGVGGLFRKIVKIGKDASSRALRQAQGLASPAEIVVERTDPKTVQHETYELLEKVETYAKLELEDVLSELDCLQKLNKLSASKYVEMASTMEGLNDFQKELFQKYDEMRPLLDEIDQLYDSICKLEQTTEQLDQYAKRLEAKASLVLSNQ